MRAALAALLVYAAASSAAAITFLSPCDDWFIKRAGVDIEFRCRSTGQRWLTVVGCPSPSAKKDASGVTTVTCSGREAARVTR